MCSRAVLALLSLFLCTSGCENGSYHSGRLRVARYSDMAVNSHSARRPSDPKQETFGTLLTEGVLGKLASLYVELPDGKRHLLSELPEAEVAKFFVKAARLPDEPAQDYKCDDGMNTRMYV